MKKLETYSLLPSTDFVAENGYAASLRDCAEFWDFGQLTILVTSSALSDTGKYFIAGYGHSADLVVGDKFTAKHDQEGYSLGLFTVLNVIYFTDSKYVSAVNDIGIDQYHPCAAFK